MQRNLQQEAVDTEQERSEADSAQCFHCGTPCSETPIRAYQKSFCCTGCVTVFELLSENGLSDYYQLADKAGIRVKAASKKVQFAYLDESSVHQRLVNFTDGKTTRVSFRIPAIHCIACVWLLENLFRLHKGIGSSQVHFPRKEVLISFDNSAAKLSEVVALLTSLGYEPDLKFSDLEKPKSRISRRLWLQLGIAGFAFGNTMLFSLSSYVGMEHVDGPDFKKLFGYISFALALPVFFYSAADYWKAAWVSLRQKLLTIEVPIAAGIVALFGQSVFEVFTGRGEGYFDSLAGLLFFLLSGKLFQQKTYDRLAFDRDYKSFFPLSVARKVLKGEERIALSTLRVGDVLLIRNGVLIPADARLLSDSATIDYSFVTGESEPVEKKSDDYLYAGGRQIGATIEVRVVKPVSQSYLTSLWNQDAFTKEKTETLHSLTNVYSYRFTKLILAIAIGAAIFWGFFDPSRSIKAFTSVLIVACPCALALAAPFALGTAQRLLAARNVFLKNASITEALAKVNMVVFDKTGTLTGAGAGAISFEGAPLNLVERNAIAAMTSQSTHPNSVRIAEYLTVETAEHVRSFAEHAGCGIEGVVAGLEIWIGSAAWLTSRGVEISSSATTSSVVHIAINKKHRGHFVLTSAIRPRVDGMLRNLSADCDLVLLSGDNEKQRESFAGLFNKDAELRFNQSPQQKLEFIAQTQQRGKSVMMVGDGLNDAGALKQGDVGIAVVDSISAFSPASDVIMSAAMVPQLDRVLEFARRSVQFVRLSFLVSTVYNVIGISIAARGLLSPVVCAILMPLSSVSVVVFASAMTTWVGRRTFIEAPQVDRKGISVNETFAPAPVGGAA